MAPNGFGGGLHVMGEGAERTRSATGTTGSGFRRCFSAAFSRGFARWYRRSRARSSVPATGAIIAIATASTIWYTHARDHRVSPRRGMGSHRQRDRHASRRAPRSSPEASSWSGALVWWICDGDGARDHSRAGVAGRPAFSARALRRFSPRSSKARRRARTRRIRGISRDSSTYSVGRGAASPPDVTSRLLREYLYHLKDLGLAPASIRRNVSALRTYFKFLLGEGHLARDPSERLESPKRWRTLPEVLSVAEVDRLLASPPSRRSARVSRSGDAGARVRRRAPRLGMDHDRHSRRDVRRRSRSSLRQGKQGAPRSDRPPRHRRPRDVRARASPAARARATARACCSSTRGASR